MIVSYNKGLIIGILGFILLAIGQYTKDGISTMIGGIAVGISLGVELL